MTSEHLSFCTPQREGKIYEMFGRIDFISVFYLHCSSPIDYMQ